MDEITQRTFWLVWNPRGGNPQHRHDSERVAVDEAERLARQNPGQTFVVLQAVAARRSDNMIRIALTADADEMPF